MMIMKRLLTSAVLFLCCAVTSFAQFSGSGAGTENDPYLILNPYQLNQLRNFLNQEGVYFKLMADIDLTEYLEDENPTQGWQPVGSSSSAAFKGIFDGNGKTISGLWIKRASTDNVGFFGYTDSAIIRDLNIAASTIEGQSYVGGISGYSKDTRIIRISFDGNIKGSSYIGGIVGQSNSIKLSGVVLRSNITGTGNYIGGIIGSSNGEYGIIRNCRINDGSIKGNDYVGGICGSCNMKVSFSSGIVCADINGSNYVGGAFGNVSFYKQEYKSTNTYGYPTYYWYYETSIHYFGYVGNITAQSYVGGVVGQYTIRNGGYGFDRVESQSICNSYVIGNIISTGDYVGGIIGDVNTSLSIKDNYFCGNLIGGNNVGGIAGTNLTEILNSYSHASIQGKQNIGGIAGSNKGTIMTSIANNTRITATDGKIGRVVGYNNNGTIAAMGSSDENKSYNKTIVICQGVAQDIIDDEMNGTSVGAASLKLKANYVAMGWDFTNTWDIQETECYPYMKEQTAPPVITSQVVSGATVISGKCVDGGTVTLLIDGVKQEKVSTGNTFTFSVSPLQAGHEVRLCAKAEGKEQSYYTTEVVSFLGKGTEADPYQVYTAADLTSVYYKGYYKLMNDIDLTEYINQYYSENGWESIGREGSETIYFDGNGHKITGLWCNSNRENTGLFSCFANGYIKDLTVATAAGKQVKGVNCTGILIGKLINGQLENSKVEGTVEGTTQTGGLIGLLSGGSITNCQANVNVSSKSANTYIGGIVGELNGTIDKCLTKGSITGTGSNKYVGGIVGISQAGSSVTNSYTTAFLSSSYCAAGIVAYNYGLVEKCYASGNIYSKNYGAGVIGYNDGSNAIVRYCAAMSKKLEVVYESQQTQQGGGYGQRIIGGIKNGAPAPVTDQNYALKTMQVSVNDVPQTVYDDIMNGTAKTGTELMAQATYEALTWDFTNTWKIEEGSSYPYLDMKEGGSDDPGDDPEPVITTNDVLSVDDITTIAGATKTVTVNLTNITTDYTGYQFDIVLPEGFSVALNSKGKLDFTKGDRYEDESQQLSMESLGNNTYRVLSFSMSNGLIEGNDGALLSFNMQVANDIEEGEYNATIKNIVFTESDGTQSEMADATFKLTVCNVIKGDANGDTKVNVSDIVEMVNYILGKPSAKFNAIAADVSEDGTVNVTDIVRVVTIIMTADTQQNMPRKNAHINSDLMIQGDDVRLNNADNYTAAQFDIILGNGQQVEDILMMNNDNHIMTWQMVNRRTCRVLIYSMTNATFETNNSPLLNIVLTGSQAEAAISNILLVPADNNTTGIHENVIDKSDELWYTINGRRLINKPTQKGIYINNGTKYVVK